MVLLSPSLESAFLPSPRRSPTLEIVLTFSCCPRSVCRIICLALVAVPPLCLSPLWFVFEFCVLSLGLENRATSSVSTPRSPLPAYCLPRKPFIPSSRAHTTLVTLVPCHTSSHPLRALIPPLIPALVHLFFACHIFCPLPPYRTRPTFFDHSPPPQLKSWAVRLNYFIPPLFSSLVVNRVFLSPSIFLSLPFLSRHMSVQILSLS